MATAVYTSMSPSAQDTLQMLLVKAAFWAQTAAGDGPFTNGMYTNMAPNPQDTPHDLAVKLAYWLQQVAGGGGVSGGGLSGTTVGTGLPPTDGSVTTLIYRDSNTGNKWVNMGTASVPAWDSI